MSSLKALVVDDDAIDLELAARYGADAFICKPYKVETFAGDIRAVLTGPVK